MRDDYCTHPLTLEKHFKLLAENCPKVSNLYSLWSLLRKDIKERLPHSRSTFVHYSLHDATHSRSVIQMVERFLGEERICCLSATDTFMLLCSAYAHDYGMAMTYNQIYDTLGEKEFTEYLRNKKKKANFQDEEEENAIDALLAYIDDAKATVSLQDQYRFIMILIQAYFRPNHWKGVEQIWGDFKGLLAGRINGRFLFGGEGIIDICEMHGKAFEDILQMNKKADGIVGDDFHPRFIAAMLRLGDLLDLDNGRFPRWFIDEMKRDRNLIPRLSILHQKKHEAVNHLLVTPKRIEVCAAYNSKQDGDEVADLIAEWLNSLEKECEAQTLYWSDITQPDFGRPPKVTKKEIKLNGKNYSSDSAVLQIRMPQDRIMQLLEGTNIYADQYVGIRELVQNAIDASLLKLWSDIKHNRYVDLGVSKTSYGCRGNEEERSKELSIFTYNQETLAKIFGNYPIIVELIEDRVDNKVYLTVEDRGIGITPKDAEYMAAIGTSKDENIRIKEIMKDMPRWLKPSGVFGIGLQSAFQLTDEIRYYSGSQNNFKYLIKFSSYGKNKGKIRIQELPTDEACMTVNIDSGTKVSIAIDPQKVLHPKNRNHEVKNTLEYYDPQFDVDDELHGIYVELARKIADLYKNNRSDYFDIFFRKSLRTSEGYYSENKHRLCYGFFNYGIKGTPSTDEKRVLPHLLQAFYDDTNTKSTIPYTFCNGYAYFFEEEKCRLHCLEIRCGNLEEHRHEMEEHRYDYVFKLPEKIDNLYNIQYKFNRISDNSSIYSIRTRKLRDTHAGFLLWDINIMDAQPEKYVNIDRNKLREGAIQEEDLNYVRQAILYRWCRHLIDSPEKKWDKFIATSEEKKAVKGIKPDNIKPFEQLLSFTLLFYQSVPEKCFKEFIGRYQEYIEKCNIKLEDTNICVSKLWDPKSNFYCETKCNDKTLDTIRKFKVAGLTTKALGKDTQENQDALKKIEFDILSRLPHRMVHIYRITLEENKKLKYYFTLGQRTDIPSTIKMEGQAMLLDFAEVMEKLKTANENNTNKKKDKQKKKKSFAKIFVDLNKQVFKPYEKYPHLVLHDYPKSFSQAENFKLPLDYCIRWYILSPFNRAFGKELDTILLSSFSEDVKEDNVLNQLYSSIERYASGETQLNRCIQYVYRQRIEMINEADKAFSDDLQEKIKKEYIDFCMDFCKLLLTNREYLLNRNDTTKSSMAPVEISEVNDNASADLEVNQKQEDKETLKDNGKGQTNSKSNLKAKLREKLSLQIKSQ